MKRNRDLCPAVRWNERRWRCCADARTIPCNAVPIRGITTRSWSSASSVARPQTPTIVKSVATQQRMAACSRIDAYGKRTAVVVTHTMMPALNAQLWMPGLTADGANASRHDRVAPARGIKVAALPAWSMSREMRGAVLSRRAQLNVRPKTIRQHSRIWMRLRRAAMSHQQRRSEKANEVQRVPGWAAGNPCQDPAICN
jgi:hypothetical protein